MTHQYHHSSDNFIVTAPTYKILNQATLVAFSKVFEGLGKYDKKDAEFKIRGGGTIYFRTQTDPDSIVGITNTRGIWADEAGKYTKYFWDNIQGRAALKACPICITTTPYSLNWIYKEIINPVKNGERDDVLLIGASSDENPYFDKKTFLQRKAELDPRKFSSMYCGQFEQMQGLVYDCFDEKENIVNESDVHLPIGTKYYAGVDWGYTEPFVIVVRAVTPVGMHYQVSEYYKSGCTAQEMAEIAKMYSKVYGIQTFYCDPSQPGHIELLNQNGVSAMKANNNVELGIEKHYQLVKTRSYKVIANSSPNTLDEYSTYHWPEPKSLLPDQTAKKPTPVGQNDHCMDANRYVTIMTANSVDRKIPKLPESLQHKRRPLQPNKLRVIKRCEEW